MPREVTHILLPLLGGAAAILSGILAIQIAGGIVIMVTLLWPVLGLRGRHESVAETAWSPRSAGSTQQADRDSADDQPINPRSEDGVSARESGKGADQSTSITVEYVMTGSQGERMQLLVAQRDDVITRMRDADVEGDRPRLQDLGIQLAQIEQELETLRHNPLTEKRVWLSPRRPSPPRIEEGPHASAQP